MASTKQSTYQPRPDSNPLIGENPEETMYNVGSIMKLFRHISASASINQPLSFNPSAVEGFSCVLDCTIAALEFEENGRAALNAEKEARS